MAKWIPPSKRGKTNKETVADQKARDQEAKAKAKERSAKLEAAIKIPTLDEHWEGFRKNVLGDITDQAELRERRNMFMAGAGAMFHHVQSVSSIPEVYAEHAMEMTYRDLSKEIDKLYKIEVKKGPRDGSNGT